jgi:predicted metal-dependent hydrolase
MPEPVTESLRIGEPEIVIRLRRNPRARRMILRVSRTGAGPVLTLPPRVPLAEARRFAQGHEPWLRSQIAARPQGLLPGWGATLTVLGEPLHIVPGPRLRSAAGLLHVPGPEPAVPARIGAFLREAARTHAVPAAERYAALIGRRPGRVTLRDTRSRWGSCTVTGDLMFCWRLALAPTAVFDYVVAHEVAHLEEMNHGPRFWALVRRLDPGLEASRAWLRRHGPELQRYAFRAAP